ncbi:MAG: hypothetical protein HYT83_02555 [Candidatus Levybacteria bacterium]|nr:hypothetical protein [Candidatus Levybacteria bacterium]
MVKKIEKYFSKHVYLNSFSHIMIGLGLGALLTNDFLNPHPVRYGLIFFVVGALGHLYAYVSKK